MTNLFKSFLAVTFLLLLPVMPVLAGDIYVSPTGDDRADGSRAHPLLTPHQALRMAREWRRTGDSRCRGGIDILLLPGRYEMIEPLFVRPEDSGTADSPTIIRGTGQTVVCGDAPQRHQQLYPASGMARMLDFDRERRVIVVPKAAVSDAVLYAATQSQHTQPGAQPEQPLSQPEQQLEMVVHQRWATAILRVKDIKVEDDRAYVSFLEPESRLEFEHPWPQPVIGGDRGNSSFLFRLTERRRGIERLVVVEGTADTPVSYVSLEDLRFEDTCWNRPLDFGHVTLQGGFPLVDAYKLQQEGLPWDAGLENQAWIERPVAAVSVNWATHVDVVDCRFSQLAATALDYGVGIDSCTISRNIFQHIGGTAILAGSFAESPREVHRPYTHLAALCDHLTINRNVIEEATEEDWGCVGIGCGYVRYVHITGNTVKGVNYSGICVGWGWTPEDTGMRNNLICDNSVTDYARQLYDAGGIYTLSNQPGSAITDNVIGRPGPAPYATNDRGFCIYLDARTDGYVIDRNLCEPLFGDNHPGPNVRWGMNGRLDDAGPLKR